MTIVASLCNMDLASASPPMPPSFFPPSLGYFPLFSSKLKPSRVRVSIDHRPSQRSGRRGCLFTVANPARAETISDGAKLEGLRQGLFCMPIRPKAEGQSHDHQSDCGEAKQGLAIIDPTMGRPSRIFYGCQSYWRLSACDHRSISQVSIHVERRRDEARSGSLLMTVELEGSLRGCRQGLFHIRGIAKDVIPHSRIPGASIGKSLPRTLFHG